MKHYTQSIKVILLSLILSFGISFVYAWTGPTTTPPGGNTDAPINTSASGQYKGGYLSVEGVIQGFSDAFFGGNVGIGTTAPGAKLDVGGGIKIGNDTRACVASIAGTIRFNSSKFEFCDGADWQSLKIQLLPTVAISVNPVKIPIEYSTTITWSSTSTNQCTASGLWGGSKALSGSEGNTPATSGAYTLTCNNTVDGTSATGSDTVAIVGWKQTTGRGALSQTCNSWLSDTKQSGYINSPPAIIGAGWGKRNNACLYICDSSSDPNFICGSDGDKVLYYVSPDYKDPHYYPSAVELPGGLTDYITHTRRE